MDYQAVILGLFRRLNQDSNIQLDFIDETALNEAELKPYKALIVTGASDNTQRAVSCLLHRPSADSAHVSATEPDIPAAGQAALVKWIKNGGHLMTVTGAAAADEYATPTTTLAKVTGIAEHPRERVMFEETSLLVAIANGTGSLGTFSAFGLRGHIKPLPDADGAVKTLATFDDGSPAIVRSDEISGGTGSATHFAFLPCIHFNNTDPFHGTGTTNWDNDTAFMDGTLPYLQEFLTNAGVAPRVQLSMTHVETPLISSKTGSILTLLNWRDAPVKAMKVTVRVDHKVDSVQLVSTGVRLKFKSTPSGGSVYSVEFVVDVEHADFVRLDDSARTSTLS